MTSNEICLPPILDTAYVPATPHSNYYFFYLTDISFKQWLKSRNTYRDEIQNPKIFNYTVYAG